MSIFGDLEHYNDISLRRSRQIMRHFSRERSKVQTEDWRRVYRESAALPPSCGGLVVAELSPACLRYPVTSRGASQVITARAEFHCETRSLGDELRGTVCAIFLVT